jgi:hypothetical protein
VSAAGGVRAAAPNASATVPVDATFEHSGSFAAEPQQRAQPPQATAVHLHAIALELAATRRALAWLAAFVVVLGLGLALQRGWREIAWLLSG